jgi:hypothetical protein
VIGSVRRVACTLSATCVLSALAVAGAPAAANALPVSFDHCDGAPLSQPFTPWIDFESYKLAPGGDFEGSLAGWTLTGGAAQTSGSESFGVTGSVGSSSLALPAGAVAVSPQTCVDAAYPDFRFFTRTSSPGTVVTVSVQYDTALGQATIPVGIVMPSGSWQPTMPMATGSTLAAVLSNGVAHVQLQFASFGGTAQVDDVFVDPTGRCC